MSTLAALAFPTVRASWLPATGEAPATGTCWREAGDEDLPFFRQLYADTRAAELAAVPWPDALRQQFLDSQFALQHQHYTSHYQPAHYLLIADNGGAVGRLYVHHDGRVATIIDIALLDRARGRGIGSALLRHVQGKALDEGLQAVVLHVQKGNDAALRLYQRLGFQTESDTGSHLLMRCPLPVLS
ncbi:MAG: GNAT family N-acetyltransferase [Stenotrophomonas sp.]